MVRPPGFGPGSLALFPSMDGRPLDALLCPRPGYPHALAESRRSHALDYGRGRRFRAFNRSNYAFAQGQPEHLYIRQQVIRGPVAINPESDNSQYLASFFAWLRILGRGRCGNTDARRNQGSSFSRTSHASGLVSSCSRMCWQHTDI